MPGGLGAVARAGCSHATWLRYEIKFERQYERAHAAWRRYQDDKRRESKGTNSRESIASAIERSLAFPR